jgi:hypothetical protein
MNGALQRLVRLRRLKAHPEGGFYRETYRSQGRIPGRKFPGGRSFSTAILFLLPKGCVSRLHRIKSDELWHFYSGGPLIVVELDPKFRPPDMGPAGVVRFSTQSGSATA